MEGCESEASAPASRIAGSFRDPSGFVFLRDGQVFRAVDGATAALLREIAQSGLFPALVDDGAVVATQQVDDPALAEALAAEHPGFRHFLRHERIEPITYPYEWTLSMLADAGAATLDLQLELLEAGLSLKDATAYNVQFVEGRPVLIDLASIERPRRMDVWFALGQFQRMFLYPLLLARHAGWDLRSYFLAHLDGLQVDRVARCFSWPQLLRPGMLFDVTLPLLLSRWAVRRRPSPLPLAGEGPGVRANQRRSSHLPLAGEGPGVRAKTPHGSSVSQTLNLRRLRRKLLRLAAGYHPRSPWSEYTRTCTYDEGAESAKKAAVEGFLRRIAPGRVLDLGCNTGEYSRLAAACGARVIAADGDHDAVEGLYRRLRTEPAPIAPVVLDLGNPSPAIGLMNRERPSFFDRVRPDCVLALALLHHLLVSGNLSLGAARDMLAELTARDLVLEFVPREDPMFRQLLRFRIDLFAGLTLDSCTAAFEKRFELIQSVPVAGTQRTLLLLRKRG